MNTIVEGGINEMYIDQEKFKSFLFAMVMFALGFALCYCMLGRADVQNNGPGINTVRNELSNAQNQQQQATERITESINTTERIQSITTTDTDLIRQCQQILSGVRQRGKS